MEWHEWCKDKAALDARIRGFISQHHRADFFSYFAVSECVLSATDSANCTSTLERKVLKGFDVRSRNPSGLPWWCPRGKLQLLKLVS